MLRWRWHPPIPHFLDWVKVRCSPNDIFLLRVMATQNIEPFVFAVFCCIFSMIYSRVSIYIIRARCKLDLHYTMLSRQGLLTCAANIIPLELRCIPLLLSFRKVKCGHLKSELNTDNRSYDCSVGNSKWVTWRSFIVQFRLCQIVNGLLCLR